MMVDRRDPEILALEAHFLASVAQARLDDAKSRRRTMWTILPCLPADLASFVYVVTHPALPPNEYVTWYMAAILACVALMHAYVVGFCWDHARKLERGIPF